MAVVPGVREGCLDSLKQWPRGGGGASALARRCRLLPGAACLTGGAGGYPTAVDGWPHAVDGHGLAPDASAQSLRLPPVGTPPAAGSTLTPRGHIR